MFYNIREFGDGMSFLTEKKNKVQNIVHIIIHLHKKHVYHPQGIEWERDSWKEILS